MKAQFVNENIDIEKWEKRHEDGLEYEDRMKNWWKVEVPDAAASGLRGHFVEDWEAMKRLAARVLDRIEKEYTEKELEEAAEIISQFVEIELDESVKDILKPKSMEEINENLRFVDFIDDLNVGDGYLILDLGMNQWLTEMVYMGKSEKNGLYEFMSAKQFDDFTIEYEFEELEEAINNNEIAFANSNYWEII